MSKVSSLSVAGYKSIRELKDFKLGDLNVLIGANGAGKSNFIGLFRLLNEMVGRQQLQLYVQKQGGPDALLHFGRRQTERLSARLFFDNQGYFFDLVATNDNRLIFESEQISFGGLHGLHHTPVLMEQGHEESRLVAVKGHFPASVQSAINSWRVYHFHDTSETAKVKQRHASNDNLRLKSDAANLAPYLRRLSQEHYESYRRIVETIRLAAPFFGDFVLREGDPEFVELEWTQTGRPDTPFRAHMLSDGTLRFICLATLLMQPVELLPETILIDEPELGLHPYAISILADMFKQVSEQRQLIVSTQSVELINELAPDDVVVVNQSDGESTFERLDAKSLSEWLQDYSLGELWKRNVFGGRP